MTVQAKTNKQTKHTLIHRCSYSAVAGFPLSATWPPSEAVTWSSMTAIRSISSGQSWLWAIQISPSSGQVQNYKWVCYFPRSWFSIRVDYDLFFLLFHSHSKITEVGQVQITFPCTKPFFLVDYTAEITEHFDQAQRGQRSRTWARQAGKPMVRLLILQMQKQTGLLLQSRGPAKGKLNQSYTQKEPKGERADSVQHNTVYRRVIENGWCHKLCNWGWHVFRQSWDCRQCNTIKADRVPTPNLLY